VNLFRASRSIIAAGVIGSMVLPGCAASIRSSDPLERIEAVNRDTLDQPTLATVATQDPSPAVRHAATGKLNDQALLARIAAEDADVSVGRLAVSRVDDLALLTRLSREAKGAEVRQAAADKATAARRREATDELFRAIENNDVASVRSILKDADLTGSREFRDPAEDGFGKRVDEFTPLTRAIYRGNIEVAECLLANGAGHSADARGNTPIHRAVMMRSKELVRLVISKGANVNARRYDKSAELTALHMAISPSDDRTSSANARKKPIDNQVEIVELLIAAGADVNAKANISFVRSGKGLPTNDPLVKGAQAKRSNSFVVYGQTREGVTVNRNDVYVIYEKPNGTPLDLAVANEDAVLVDLLRKHGGTQF